MLDDFLRDMAECHALDLDHVYVGKALYALFEMVADGEIPQGARVVAVVTGSPARSAPAPTPRTGSCSGG
jgi:1-aminocyclopropane-1-carboxylate deaminase